VKLETVMPTASSVYQGTHTESPCADREFRTNPCSHDTKVSI